MTNHHLDSINQTDKQLQDSNSPDYVDNSVDGENESNMNQLKTRFGETVDLKAIYSYYVDTEVDNLADEINNEMEVENDSVVQSDGEALEDNEFELVFLDDDFDVMNIKQPEAEMTDSKDQLVFVDEKLQDVNEHLLDQQSLSAQDSSTIPLESKDSTISLTKAKLSALKSNVSSSLVAAVPRTVQKPTKRVTTDLSISQIAGIMVTTIALVTWFKTDKLSAYWMQEYEDDKPFSILGDSTVGRAGQWVERLINRNNLESNLSTISQSINLGMNQVVYHDEMVKLSQLKQKKEQARLATEKKREEQENQAMFAALQAKVMQEPLHPEFQSFGQQQQQVVKLVDAEETIKADPMHGRNLQSVNVSDSHAEYGNTQIVNDLSPERGHQNQIQLTNQNKMAAMQLPTINQLHQGSINITNGQKALFVGDSLMQGVAPWVMRKLQGNYQIDSIDLSKHSTGLVHSKFFDWPMTVEQALSDNPDVVALFVFLGGNDGGSMVDPETQRHVRFGSERWDELYAGKIQRILDTAKANNVQVLWMAPPKMKKQSLSKKTDHLSELFDTTVPNSQGIVLHSKEILQLETAKDKYSDSMLIDGKLVKVRTADGVHFTTKGQKVLAKSMMERIHVNGQPMQYD